MSGPNQRADHEPAGVCSMVFYRGSGIVGHNQSADVVTTFRGRVDDTVSAFHRVQSGAQSLSAYGRGRAAGTILSAAARCHPNP